MIHISSVSVLVLVFFTGTVTAACPSPCLSCDEFGCTSCNIGSWGLKAGCQYSCNAACFNGTCNATNGYCNKCNSGFYGPGCQHNCSMCEEGLCDLRACTKGCKAGYYEYKTNVETMCWSCSARCRSCINNAVCSACNDGFSLYKHEINGKTAIQCIQCQHAAACSSLCEIQNCKQCRIHSGSLLCTQCSVGYRFNGDICIPNENNCVLGCSSDCDENGMCLGNCNAGWTGERCSDSCTNECLKCHKNNPNVCEECKGDSYTATCDVDCSPSCIKVSGKQTCRINDGFCMNGCGNTFWGQLCNQSCSNGCDDDGVSQVCDRHNGICKSGCIDGYTGDKCETTIPKKSTTQPKAESSKIESTLPTENHVTPTTSITTQSETCLHCQCEVNCDKDTYFAIGYVSGIGTTVFIVAVTVALHYIRRRYISRKSKTSGECTVNTDMSTRYVNETAAQKPVSDMTNNDASNYESLGSNRNTDKVYSELETSEANQSHKYYNMDFSRRQ